ncbi:MAG: hypothetical protein M1818_000312 [Claussenomyces sp. TS43310]|nr:MAG: hypothetical protein M1818_000312 [Claussenomyces sp. TS43310]
MSDDDESDYDADLKRAIALSLLEAKSSPAEFVSLLSDSDDDGDLDRAPVRRSEHVKKGYVPSKTSASSVPDRSSLPAKRDVIVLDSDITDTQDSKVTAAAPAKPGPSPAVSSLATLGIDRKAMEAERVARANKRKAAASPPPPSRGGLDSSRAVSETESHRAVKRLAVRPPDPANPSPGLRRRLLIPAQHMQAEPLHPAQVIPGWKSKAAQTGAKMRGDGAQEAVCPIPSLSRAFQTPSRVQGKRFLIPAQLRGSAPLAPEDVIPDMRFRRLPEATGTPFENKPLLGVASYWQQQDLLTSGVKFPDGVVKKTWAYGYPRVDDIKIEEVLQKTDLELAVLSAFQWDEEWILSKVDMSRTKVICVVQAETEGQKAEMRANVPPNIRFCFPSMAGQINCMHSKLMILSHPDYLRVVVPSANLVPYDWGEGGGIMENMVFIIDLPRLAPGHKAVAQELTPFARELHYYLQAQEMDPRVVNSLLAFDFSRTAPFAFVHSIGGSHVGDSWKRTGYCGLGSAIKELGLATQEPVELDVVSASIGNLREDFIRSMYLAAKGDNGLTEYNWRNNKTPGNKSALSSTNSSATRPQLAGQQEVWQEAQQRVRIYFPSRETVVKSKGGIKAAGTICFQPQWYAAASFPRSLMRDCESVRKGMLMHNKLLFARPQQSYAVHVEEHKPTTRAWTYIGSANLSESAWGRLVKDKATQAPKLNCRNWECGVVVHVHHTSVPVDANREITEKLSEGGKNDAGKATCNGGAENIEVGMKIFEDIVPVPMVIPSEEYRTRRPWFYNN